MLALVLLSIIKDCLDYISSRNDQGENRFNRDKNEKENAIFVALLTLLL